MYLIECTISLFHIITHIVLIEHIPLCTHTHTHTNKIHGNLELNINTKLLLRLLCLFTFHLDYREFLTQFSRYSNLFNIGLFVHLFAHSVCLFRFCVYFVLFLDSIDIELYHAAILNNTDFFLRRNDKRQQTVCYCLSYSVNECYDILIHFSILLWLVASHGVSRTFTLKPAHWHFE